MAQNNSKTEYIQPLVMGIASLLNVVGSVSAISVGADRTEKGVNPFFYLSMTTSMMYLVANAVKVGQIYQSRTKSFVEKLAEERQMEEGLIQRGA